MRGLGTRVSSKGGHQHSKLRMTGSSPATRSSFFRCSSKAERTAVNRGTEVRVLSPEPFAGEQRFLHPGLQNR
jgi:hypothetical protein